MMKIFQKITCVTLLLVVLVFGNAFFPSGAFADDHQGTFQKIAHLEARGLLNFLSTPFELPATIRREREIHPKAWPFTSPLRFMNNVIYRLASSAVDMTIHPFAAPFNDEIRPLTSHVDLPDYAWQKDDTELY